MLQGSQQARETITASLSRGYFHRGQKILSFLGNQSAEILRYLFGSPPIALIALVGALAGVGLLAARRNASAVLLALPPLFGAFAGLLGGYPFVGTRQSLYLLPFVLAAIGVAFSAVAGGRPWVKMTALLLIPFLWKPPAPAGPQSLTFMNAAMEEVRRSAPRRSLIIADLQTGVVLRYYFNREGATDYRLVRLPMWAPDSKTFADEVDRIVRVQRLAVGQRFWVVRIGPEMDADREVLRRFPNASLSSRSFGDLSVMEVRL